MSDKERIMELIDIYCDADRRMAYSKEELEQHSPTLERVIEIMGGAK